MERCYKRVIRRVLLILLDRRLWVITTVGWLLTERDSTLSGAIEGPSYVTVNGHSIPFWSFVGIESVLGVLLLIGGLWLLSKAFSKWRGRP